MPAVEADFMAAVAAGFTAVCPAAGFTAVCPAAGFTAVCREAAGMAEEALREAVGTPQVWLADMPLALAVFQERRWGLAIWGQALCRALAILRASAGLGSPLQAGTER